MVAESSQKRECPGKASARASISICKFIGIPWHPFLHLAPPRDRILENTNIFFRKKTTKIILLVYLSKKKIFIKP